ncbi:hypothetical protein [Paractinoplanes rishiriensis]|uniref:XRE family transcriptional regulator n=1 Tax=Paractinoplanes rishiriensis TaxID=1050105 RepID=A0A919MV82_9ACTN|nr:hypothetical protein [Actinoplanes rishiriensis]GIF01122.1 hypothetical protein Ari01nite_85860 [Actinoplanes rishiriensis]
MDDAVEVTGEMVVAREGNRGKNWKLIAARERRTMPDGEPMQPQDVAEAMNVFLWAEHQRNPKSPEPTILDHRFVLAYEAGRYWWPSAHYRAAFRHVLDVATDAELGFTPKRQRRDRTRTAVLPSGPSAASESSSVEERNRRGLSEGSDWRSLRVGGLLSALYGLGEATMDLDDLNRFHAVVRDASRVLGADLVRYLGERLDRCANDDGVRGPRHALPGTLGVLALVQHSVRDVKPQVRRPLLAVGSRAAEFAGWLYRDCGQSSAADYWRDRACEWAVESADFAMPGYLLVKKSQSAWDNRDASKMLGLAQAVREGPWRLPARVMAEAAQQQARGMAMLRIGQRQVDDVLKEARSLLDLAAEDRTSLAAHYDTALFEVQTAICYVECGRLEEAVDIYESTLTAALFSARDLAYFSALKGQALVAAGRVDDAALTGATTLGTAFAAGSARTVRELSRLRHRLEPWRARPTVREFLQLMDAV